VQRLQARPVERFGPGEQRVVRVDDADQLGGQPTADRGRTGHRDLVADPDALIPDEHQVRLRPEDKAGRAE